MPKHAVTVVKYVNFDPTTRKVTHQEQLPLKREKAGIPTHKLDKIAGIAQSKPHEAVPMLCKELEAMSMYMERIQDNLEKATKPLRTDPEIFRTIIKDQHFTVGNNTFKHGLGKPYSGWRITRPRKYLNVAIASAPGFYEVANGDSSLNKEQLIINALVECVADLEVW